MLYGSIEAGGTKFVCAVGNEKLEILERVSFPTTTPDETMPQVIAFFNQYKEELQAINIQLYAIVFLVISGIISLVITYNQKLDMENKKTFFNSKESLKITSFNRKLGLIISLVFLYINIKLYNLSISFILETPGTLGGAAEKDIINFGNVDVFVYYNGRSQAFHLIFNDLRQELEPFSTYMIVLRWDKKRYVCEMNVYKYRHPDNVPIYKLRPDMYYFDFENPICEMVGSYNNDFEMRSGMDCQIHAYPIQMTNVKLYNKCD